MRIYNWTKTIKQRKYWKTL